MFNLQIISMQQEWNQPFEIPQNTGKYQSRDAATKTPYIDTQYPLSFGYEETLMETSFEENLAEDHANAIWKASIIFLKNSVKVGFDQNKGFNNANIFQCSMDLKESLSEQTEIIYLISKNSILTLDQKSKFISATKREKDLKKLLEHSSQLFCQQIFEELILIFYEAWEKYLIFKQTTKLSSQLSKLLGPSYDDIDKAKNLIVQNYYFQETESQIISKAEKIASQIAGCYFISTKMRYLNLKEATTASNESNRIRKQFQQFVEIIVKGVYLCLQGCFYNPNRQNNMTYPTLTQNSSFSQSLIKQDLNDGLNGQARKRIKQ